jgi:hypothetical protein
MPPRRNVIAKPDHRDAELHLAFLRGHAEPRC